MRHDGRAPLRLSRQAQNDLDDALAPHELTATLRAALERHLTAYATIGRWSGADVKRWRSYDRALITTARRLLDLIEHHSLQDMLDALDHGEAQSALHRALAARLAEWEARQLSARAGRPEEWDRRILVWRVMTALDAADVPDSCHVDAPQVRFLRLVLKMADKIDGRRPGLGSLRLIRAVWRHRRQRETWTPHHVLFLRYERPLLWPAEK